jgi:uncharacterized protein YbgA (DUF1722 family)
MRSFTSAYLAGVPPCDGAILKYGSPSCGLREVKAYTSPVRGASSTKTSGLFGAAVADRLPTLPIEDEGRLRNFDLRQHFLTRLFTLTRFRVAVRSRRMRDLISFYAQHKLLLMAYNQTEMRVLGRTLANAERLPIGQVESAYHERLGVAFSRAPRRNSAINVLMHAFGYVSEGLSTRERDFFLDILENYRAARCPLSVPSSLVRSWIARFDVSYLAYQFFFEPFPPDLIEVLDFGKGRNVHQQQDREPTRSSPPRTRPVRMDSHLVIQWRAAIRKGVL